MKHNTDFLNKSAIIADLALIASCLRLLNANISYSKSHGEDFSVSENEEIYKLISKIDKNLNRIKKNIQYET